MESPTLTVVRPFHFGGVCPPLDVTQVLCMYDGLHVSLPVVGSHSGSSWDTSHLGEGGSVPPSSFVLTPLSV